MFQNKLRTKSDIQVKQFHIRNQNVGINFNQNHQNNQGQVFQPPTNQPPVYQVPPYQAPTPQIQGVSKTDFENYVKANDAVLKNVQNQGTLPSQTVTNPREHVNAITTRSGKTCEGPSTSLLLPTTRCFYSFKENSVQKPVTKIKHLSGKEELVYYADKSEKNEEKKFVHAISIIDFSKDDPFSGSTTIPSDDPFPSSSLMKTSDSTFEEFIDEFTLPTLYSGIDDFIFIRLDIHEEIFSNPLFEFDDNFKSSNVNPLFEENDKDVEIKSSSSFTLKLTLAEEKRSLKSCKVAKHASISSKLILD
ncbi:hypothetical protein Tco_0936879 [Tanacetum coccineum]|uniref:Reverse transcriptase domain-containing protein n=1 Tax=Tanacetum coccineum TaxID=301880 RepID=A0ABQ5DJN4_9ASTR